MLSPLTRAVLSELLAADGNQPSLASTELADTVDSHTTALTLTVTYTPLTVSASCAAVTGKTHLVNTSTTAITLTLPAPASGVFVIVKDASANASTHNITINPHASETIDGGSNLVISADKGKATLMSDGTNWFQVA